MFCAFFNSISSAFDIIWQINRQTNGYPSNESIKINHLWTVNQEMATFSLVFASCRCNRSLVGPRTICAWVHDNYIIRPGDYRSTVPHNGRGVSPRFAVFYYWKKNLQFEQLLWVISHGFWSESNPQTAWYLYKLDIISRELSLLARDLIDTYDAWSITGQFFIVEKQEVTSKKRLLLNQIIFQQR